MKSCWRRSLLSYGQIYGCLYDVRSPDFKNRDKRQVAIEEIATKLYFFPFFEIFLKVLLYSAILNRSPKFENLENLSYSASNYALAPCLRRCYTRQFRLATCNKNWGQKDITASCCILDICKLLCEL